mgnify:CR=1 FL=1
MVHSTTVSGTAAARKTVRVSKSGLMARSTKATGKTIKQTEEEDSFMPTATYITASGKMIRPTVMVSTTTLTAQSTKANGKRINNTVKVKKSGLIMPAMKVCIRTERSMDTVNLTGQMVQPTLEISSIITLREAVNTPGVTEDNTMVNGAITKCTALVSSHGTMAVVMRESTTTIRKKVMESSPGPMVANTTALGKTESSTAKVPTTPADRKLRKAPGKKVNVSLGLTTMLPISD